MVPTDAIGFSLKQHRDEQSHTNQHVQCVQAGHGKVQKVKHVRSRPGRGGNMTRPDLLVILQSFDGYEERPQQDDTDQQPASPPALSVGAEMIEQRDQQAGSQQQPRVHGSEHQVGLANRLAGQRRMQNAHDEVTQNQSTEKKHFSGQKDPEPKIHRFPLLGHVRKLGMMDGLNVAPSVQGFPSDPDNPQASKS
jgi:hypothetical protein